MTRIGLGSARSTLAHSMEEARAALAEVGVIHAGLFGSVARGEAGADSDIDVLVAFSPGQNASVRPWGTIGWARAVSVQGWTKSHKRDFDYAMIVLSQDIGNQLGWMGYGWKNPLPKYNVNINGYPGDKPFGTMWHAFCGLQTIQTYRLYYACDTFGGMSGSHVYVYFNTETKRTIYGIHAYGVDRTGLNGATRITKSVFDNLSAWKAKY